MAVKDDLRDLLGEQLHDELSPTPILDQGAAHDCGACGCEGTNDHPVLAVRVVDFDGSVFPRMCVDCLAGLAAHTRRGL